MRICKEDKQKITFKIWYSHFKYQVILFGLSNTSTSFKSYISKVLVKKLDVFMIVYLDNILIYTNEVDHVESVWWILNQL